MIQNIKLNTKYFLKVGQYEHKEEFLKFSFTKDHLDVAFNPFFVGNNSFKNRWVKIVFKLLCGLNFSE